MEAQDYVHFPLRLIDVSNISSDNRGKEAIPKRYGQTTTGVELLPLITFEVRR